MSTSLNLLNFYKVNDMQEKESCLNCKRSIGHDGTCTLNKGMFQTCLGYEKDPRGRLIRESGKIKLEEHNFKVGEWTKDLFVSKSKPDAHRLKIRCIDEIKWSDELNDYDVSASYEYFENEIFENEDVERCQMKEYLKTNNIKNVVMFKTRSN